MSQRKVMPYLLLVAVGKYAFQNLLAAAFLNSFLALPYLFPELTFLLQKLVRFELSESMFPQYIFARFL